MEHLPLILKNRPYSEKSFQTVYGNAVEKKIREKYSLSEELAVLRQRDTKQEAFLAYFRYAELCKEEVRKELEAKENAAVL